MGNLASTRPLVSEVSRPALYLALTKPDVSVLVVMTTLAGYVLGTQGPLDWMRMGHAVFATALLSAGTSALNQYLERDVDAKMSRTASRPLPSGQLLPDRALWFGIGLAAAGTLYLALATNGLATLLGALTSVVYLYGYTPLKRRTTLAKVVGAFPGATPPLIGWAAARGAITPDAWALFAILFLWQFPHFNAISWLYREDYRRAGIRMLSAGDTDGKRLFREVLFTATLLIPVSLIPVATGLAGRRYCLGALVVGVALVEMCRWVARSKENSRARWLIHATVIQLPLLLGLLIWDKIAR